MSVEPDQLLALQMAVEEQNDESFLALIDPYSGEDLSNTQLFADASLLMYVCHKGTPEMASRLLGKGLKPLELPFSDNNEIKSCCLNHPHGAEMLELILGWIDPELGRNMVESDWGLEGEEDSITPMDLAQQHPDPRLKEILEAHMSKL